MISFFPCSQCKLFCDKYKLISSKWMFISGFYIVNDIFHGLIYYMSVFFYFTFVSVVIKFDPRKAISKWDLVLNDQSLKGEVNFACINKCPNKFWNIYAFEYMIKSANHAVTGTNRSTMPATSGTGPSPSCRAATNSGTSTPTWRRWWATWAGRGRSLSAGCSGSPRSRHGSPTSRWSYATRRWTELARSMRDISFFKENF